MDATIHPSLPPEAVAGIQGQIDELLPLVADREPLLAAVAQAHAAIKAKEAAIVAACGVPYDSRTGAYHPALAPLRHALRAAQNKLRANDEVIQKIESLRRVLATGRSRPEFRCYQAPPVRDLEPGTKMVFDETGRPRIERIESKTRKVCEFDGEAGKERRRQRHN